MSTVQYTAAWKNKAVYKVSDMSGDGKRTHKVDDKVDPCGRGSWWLGTLRVGVILQYGFMACLRGRGCYISLCAKQLKHLPLDCQLKDTPIPGHYQIRDFIEEAELNPVWKTYGFKGMGRKSHILGIRKGDLLLPGAYDHTDSIQEVLKHQASYSFKNCPRPDIITLGVRDKDVHTSPCDYNVTAKPVEKIPCKHVMFRSTVQRISFPPKEGPAPCHYDPQSKPAKGITSCFKSTSPRLHVEHSITPGPGAYEPCWKLGDRINPADIDPSFSLFFRNTV